MKIASVIVVLVCTTLVVDATTVLARDIFVDNLSGNDRLTGISNDFNDFVGGPVKSIRRALILARAGDVIILKNNNTPYYEPVILNGVRHNGLATAPLIIQGNGATISGFSSLPSNAWFPVGYDLWKVTPAKKGWYQLVHNDKAVPEIRVPAGVGELPEIPPGHWCAWKGAVYYRANPQEDVQTESFGLSREDMGISLHRVRNVRIENLVVQHFRIDGINAHDGCRNVELVNVVSQENGRAGLVAAGTSDLVFANGKLLGNRDYSLLVTERAAAIVNESELSTPAVMAEE
ncbi:MAG: hypothetical protein O2955_07415 [Planctomycetota bacterium]|nr:hypothetical protein [Planctomycetota bacterium]MDA1212327.1 hypothetical protein [Planctomycetota bacterium]